MKRGGGRGTGSIRCPCGPEGPLQRAQVWEMERRGEFPKRVQISARRVAWRAGDIRDWLASRKVIEPDTPVSHLLGWPEGVNHRTTVAAATQVSA